MNGGLKFGLGFTGMSAAEIADLEAKLPAMQRAGAALAQLEPLLKQAEPHLEVLAPLLTQALPHIAALLPLAAQASSIVKPVWPDITASTPTLLALLAFAEGKK